MRGGRRAAAAAPARPDGDPGAASRTWRAGATRSRACARCSTRCARDHPRRRHAVDGHERRLRAGDRRRRDDGARSAPRCSAARLSRIGLARHRARYTAPPRNLRMATTADRIAFIGGGNMARSLIGGLLARGTAAARIRVAEPVAAAARGARARLRRARARDDNAAAAARRSVVGAGGQAAGDARGLRGPGARWRRRSGRWWCRSPPASPPRSSSAGSAAARAIVRAMPNTPALLGAGVDRPVRERAGRRRRSATRPKRCCAPPAGTVVDRRRGADGRGHRGVRQRARPMSSCWPRRCRRPAKRRACRPTAARALALQTAARRGAHAAESGETPPTLRRRVTSPGGTTQAAIETLRGRRLPRLVARAIVAATERGRELSAAND